jgi:RNA polymerase sporulation-specific sigma factor
MSNGINELIMLSQSGDTSAKEKIYEDNKAVIWHIIKRTLHDPNDTADLFQTGAVAMVKAINSYDTTKNVKFSTFAFTCIQRSLFNKAKQSYKYRSNIAIYEYAGDYKNKTPQQFTDTLTARETLIDSDTRIDLYYAINALGALHKRVIKLLFSEDKTQEEAAGILNMSQSHVSRLKTAALRQLRETMACG